MRHSIAAVLTLAIGMALSSGARAQDPMDRPGLDIAVRFGFAYPFGKVTGDPGDGLSQGFSGAVPIVLEAGYRINAYVTVGVLAQLGYALVAENQTTGCGGSVSCSGSVMRLGIEALFRIPVEGPVVPWLGVGTGYEWLSIDASGYGATDSVGAHGFELATLQGGGDFHISSSFSLGPFVSFSLARFDTATGTDSADIQNKALHEWLQIGLKGTFSL